MIKILTKEEYQKKFGAVYDPSGEATYYLDNGVVLWRMDWNGEIYTESTRLDETGNIIRTETEYEPVYEECFGDYEIVGFVER